MKFAARPWPKVLFPLFSLLFLLLYSCSLLQAQSTSLWEKAKALSKIYKEIEKGDANSNKEAKEAAAVAFFDELRSLYVNPGEVSDTFINNQFQQYEYLRKYVDHAYSYVDTEKEARETEINEKKDAITEELRRADLEQKKIFPLLNGTSFADRPEFANLLEQLQPAIDTVSVLDTAVLNINRLIFELQQDVNPNVAATPPEVDVPSSSQPTSAAIKAIALDTLFNRFLRSDQFQNLTGLNPEDFADTRGSQLPANARLQNSFEAYTNHSELTAMLDNNWHEDCEENGLDLEKLREQLAVQDLSREAKALRRTRNRLRNPDCLENRLLEDYYPGIIEVSVEPMATSEPEPVSSSAALSRRLIISGIETVRTNLKNYRARIADLTREIDKLNGSDQPFNQDFQPITFGLMSNSELEQADQLLPTIVLQQQGNSSLQSSIIDGTSKWIAERMKEELNIAFFDRFERWLEGRNISILFPNTYTSIKSSLTTDYELMIKIFKSAFEKDLRQMPFNLALFIVEEFAYDEQIGTLQSRILEQTNELNILRELEISDLQYQVERNRDQEQSPYQQSIQDNTEVLIWEDLSGQTLSAEERLYAASGRRDALQAALANDQKALEQLERDYRIMKYIVFTIRAVQQLNEGKHPTALLGTLLNQGDANEIPDADHLSVGLATLNTLSRSLLSKAERDSSTVWIKGRQLFEDLIQDPDLRNFFFGLIHREIKTPSLLAVERIRQQMEVRQQELNEEKIMAAKTEFADMKRDFDYRFEYTVDEDFVQQYLHRLPDMSEQEIELLTDQLMYTFSTTIYGKANSHQGQEVFISNMISGLIDYARSEEISALIALAYPPPLAGSGTDPARSNTDYFAEVVEEIVDQTGGDDELRSETQKYFDNIILNANKYYRDSSIYGGTSETLVNSLRQELEELIPENEALNDKILESFDRAEADIKRDIEKNVPPVTTSATEEVVEVSESQIQAQLSFWEKIDAHIETLKNEQEKEYLRLTGPAEVISDAQTQRLRYELRKSEERVAFIDNLVKPKSGRLQDLFVNFVQYSDQVDFIQAELKQLQKLNKANLGSREFIFFIKNSLEVLFQAYEIAIPTDEASVVTTIKDMTSSLLDAYASVLEKDYDAVVMNAMPIAERLVDINYRNKIRKLENELAVDGQPIANDSDTQIALALLDGYLDRSEINKLTAEQKKKIKDSFKSPTTNRQAQLQRISTERADKVDKIHQIFKYGAFLAAVVESRDAEAIKNAIQAIALPTGSYSIKRRTLRNISLNAYPGLTAGYELASNSSGEAWAPNFGFTAPVGLAFSWGYKSQIDGLRYHSDPIYRKRVERANKFGDSQFLGGHSGSLFFPLIDLGAIVLFRLDNTDEALPQDVGFQQIFSPGVLYGHGFPNVPLTLMAGVQVSPKLRTINEEKANAIRFNVSLVVDLPMANFYTKTRKRR